MQFYLNLLAADPGIPTRKPVQPMSTWAGCRSLLSGGKIVSLSEIIKLILWAACSNLNSGCQQERISVTDLLILVLINKWGKFAID